jgi:predicted signal transduction protein with EAL and GGDEF domain
MSLFDTVMLFDVRTLHGILFWLNLILMALILAFKMLTKTVQDKVYIQRALIARILFTITFLMLLMSNHFPYSISVNLSLLLFSLYLDARLLMLFLAGAGKMRHIILNIIIIVGIIAFNTLEIMFANDTIRTIVVTHIILAIYGVPTVLILKNGNSRFKKAVGGFYIFFLVTLFPRMIIPMSAGSSSHYDRAITQSAVYLALLIITVIGTIAALLFIKERNDAMLENMAMNDQLTQIPNRHSFFLNANMLFLKCQREKSELALMFMDIDYFKKINDKYGHDFGDIVLKRFALVIKESARQYDLICRYGGAYS